MLTATSRQAGKAKAALAVSVHAEAVWQHDATCHYGLGELTFPPRLVYCPA